MIMSYVVNLFERIATSCDPTMCMYIHTDHIKMEDNYQLQFVKIVSNPTLNCIVHTFLLSYSFPLYYIIGLQDAPRRRNLLRTVPGSDAVSPESLIQIDL